MPQTTATVNFVGNTSGLIGQVDMLLSKFNQLGQVGQKINGTMARMVQPLQNGIKAVTDQVLNLNRVILSFGAGIRQIGQGLMSFGTMFSVLVSAPVGALLMSWTKEAISFQDQLIELRKTAGLTNAELKGVGEGITQISLASPTSRVDLGKIAADWGRLGVELPSQILKLTKAADMMVIATDMSADDVVKNLGRIGIIYAKNTQEFVDNVDKWGSAINELGQANAIGEKELVSTALRIAPVAKALGITEQQLLAIAATAATTNASAERAGTEVASALFQMVKNSDDLAKAIGLTDASLRQLFAENPGQFFIDLAASVNTIPDPLDRVTGAVQTFGTVGSKAILSMGSNLQLLRDNLQISNEAWSAGTSLQMEYLRALDSVQNQLGLLRNNLIYVGTAFGDVLLPYITKFAALSIPALQLLAEYFKQLSEPMKLTIVGFALLLAVVGPLVVALGTFMFSLGIILTGLSSIAVTLFSVVSGVAQFMLGLVAAISPVSIAVAALAGLAVVAYQVSADLRAAENVVLGYINAAFSWGYNLISSFGEGVMAAASALYNAVVSVINSIIGLLEAFSPPKEGPLKNIKKWGKGVMEAFAAGMAEADMSNVERAVNLVSDTLRDSLSALTDENLDIFSKTFNSIKSTISAVGAHFGMEQGSINSWFTNASQVISDFINNVQDGVRGSLGPIAEVLGGLQDDFENLINLQIEYTATKDRLDEIKKSIEGINGALDDEIRKIMASTDLTVEQKSVMIRQAKLAAAARRQNLESEQRQAENQVSELEKQADRQQKLIDIFTSLIFPAEEGGGGGGGGGGADKKPPKEKKPKLDDLLGFDLQKLDDLTEVPQKLSEKFDEAGAKVENFIEKISRAREVIAGFIAGIRGDDPAQYAAYGENFWLGFSKGSDIRTTVTTFLTSLEPYRLRLLAIGLAFHAGFLLVQAGINAGYYGITAHDSELSGVSNILFKIGLWLGLAVLAIESFFFSLRNADYGTVLDTILTKLSDMKTAFMESFDPDGSITRKIQGLGTALQPVGEVLAAIALLVFDNMDELAGSVGAIVGFLGDVGLDALIFIGVLAELALISTGHGDVQRLATNLGLINTEMAKWAGPLAKAAENFGKFMGFLSENDTSTSDRLRGTAEALSEFDKVVQNIGNTLWTGVLLISAALSEFVKGFSEAFNSSLIVDITTIPGLIGTTFKTLAAVIGLVAKPIGMFAGAIAAWILNIIVILGGLGAALMELALIIAGVGDMESLKNALKAIHPLFEHLPDAIMLVVDWIGRLWEKIDSFVAGVGRFLETTRSQGILVALIEAMFGADMAFDISQWLWDNIGQPISDAWNNLWEFGKLFKSPGAVAINESQVPTLMIGAGMLVSLWNQVMYPVIQEAWNQLWEQLKSAIGKKATESWSEYVLRIIDEALNDLFASVGKDKKKTWGAFILEKIMEVFAYVRDTLFGEKGLFNIFGKGGILSLLFPPASTEGDSGGIGAIIAGLIVSVFNSALETVKSDAALLGNALLVGTTVAMEAIRGISEWFNFRNLAVAFDLIVTTGMTWVATVAGSILKLGTDFATPVIQGIRDFFNLGSSNFITDLVTNLGTWISEKADDILTKGKSIGKGIIDGIVEHIKGAGNIISEAIMSIIPDFMDEIFKDSFLPDLEKQSAQLSEGLGGGKLNSMIQNLFRSDEDSAEKGQDKKKTSPFASMLQMTGDLQKGIEVFTTQLVTQVATSLSTLFASELATTPIMTAINTMFMMVAGAGMEMFMLNGQLIGMHVINGMTLLYSLMATVLPPMNALNASIMLWIATFMGMLQQRGAEISLHIKTGLQIANSLEPTYMQPLFDQISAWVSSQESNFIELGKKIGEYIITGVMKALDDGTTEIAQAIAQMIKDAIRQAGAKLNNGSGAVGSASVGAASVYTGDGMVSAATMYNPPVTSSAERTMSININVDVAGETGNNRELAQRIADDLYARLGKDLRLARIRT
jgi:TP901 family phage tail tape measure protein